ncbi:hypothetical protein [Nitrosospira multiformis]|uniref:hypothetical protein n=1 Tax=Nitrosospira multiformis TaxID=1231 RepID=UPI003F743897
MLDFRQFSFRGLGKVSTEWKLFWIMLNLRRMMTATLRTSIRDLSYPCSKYSYPSY